MQKSIACLFFFVYTVKHSDSEKEQMKGNKKNGKDKRTN